jgi:thiol-disulfide isomerase/thioredoxin
MNSFQRNLATLGAAFAYLTLSAAGPPKVGDTFPALTSGGDLEGTVPDLTGKVVLVDFWASWCAPCKESFPAMKELHEKYSTQGLVVVAVSIDDDKADMEAFLKKNPMPFTLVRDPKSTLFDTKLGLTGVPVSCVLDKQGKVAFIHSGYEGKKTKRLLTEKVESLLKN